MIRATYIHQWNWTEGLRHLSIQHDLLVPLELTLGGFSWSFALDFFLCDLTLYPVQCSRMICAGHAKTCFADVTSDSQLIMDFCQMSGYCFYVTT